jgi:hypothetical protein
MVKNTLPQIGLRFIHKLHLADIVYNAPEVVETPVQKNEWMFESSSGDGFYKVRQNGVKLTCNCPGSWRAKDRRCKHIKEVEQLIK